MNDELIKFKERLVALLDTFYIDNKTDEELADLVNELLSYSFFLKCGYIDLSKCSRAPNGSPVYADQNLIRYRRIGWRAWIDTNDGSIDTSVDFLFKCTPQIAMQRCLNVCNILKEKYNNV
jgi:hypothetical protein